MQRQMRREEDTLKDDVYNYFDVRLRERKHERERAQKYVKSGAYEDSAAASVYSEHTKACAAETTEMQLYRTIYPSPYFSHMEISGDDGDKMQIMLSDAENLNENIQIDDQKMIMPFKNGGGRQNQLLRALYHAYQEHDKAHVFYIDVEDRLHGDFHKEKHTVQLIRSVDIKNRELKQVVQFYPPLTVTDSKITAESGIASSGDELLQQKLAENREDAKLRNIIATLQREQFDIIQTPLETSFAVQGCAGSGKTQCLIHRLFFFRDKLNESGWDKVLLITPSQLFRAYSMNLMRRFHLSTVDNCSIANFYCTLLEAFDPRFKKRQYEFELSEEYLPDEYLHQIYEPKLIAQIQSQIKSAIFNHANDACKILGISNIPQNIDINYIGILVKQLNQQIAEFDRRVAETARDTEYKTYLDELDKSERKQKTAQERIIKFNNDLEQLEMQKRQYDELKQQIADAEEELSEWKKSQQPKLDEQINTAEKLKCMLAGNTEASVEDCIAYSDAIAAVLRSAGFAGQKIHGIPDEHEEYLKDLCRMAHEYLSDFLGRSERSWIRLYESRKKGFQTLISTNQQLETLAAHKADECRTWLEKRNAQNESIDMQRKTYRERLEKSRYYLSRIESSVFEQEIWNTIQPIKEAHGVKSVRMEQLENGHQRQTRILYKSDLLFYLHIYSQLYPHDSLPDYRYICIDEGQDLHRADYDMLRTLYPDGVLNIFGDTMQLLHEACGVTDWKQDTGVESVFDLDTNYRNVPAIVNFCNYQFKSHMKYVGEIQNQQKPLFIARPSELKRIITLKHPHIIVKNRDAFEQLCLEAQIPVEEFEYLDLSASKETEEKNHCYSIFAAKGLEFSSVLVYAKNMTNNQKIVASTRAMENLYYYE